MMHSKWMLITNLIYQVLVVTKAQLVQEKTRYWEKAEDVEKNHNSSGLVKKTDYNAELTEIENNIPSVAWLGTTTSLNTKTTEVEQNTWYNWPG